MHPRVEWEHNQLNMHGVLETKDPTITLAVYCFTIYPHGTLLTQWSMKLHMWSQVLTNSKYLNNCTAWAKNNRRSQGYNPAGKRVKQ